MRPMSGRKPTEMNTSTDGLQLNTDRRWLANITELLSSMRFAISLLSLLAIASVIGTVLKQNEPMTNYVNQFGPFWFEVFGKLGLYAVYSAWWFLLIMAFLVSSSFFCFVCFVFLLLVVLCCWCVFVRVLSLCFF